MDGSISDLPNALAAKAGLAEAMGGKRPAVFLDYDGVLTPIVDRPEDARASPPRWATPCGGWPGGPRSAW